VKLFFNSITKAFTGVAIMQLVENGKLSWRTYFKIFG
jgi:hypothetical protein